MCINYENIVILHTLLPKLFQKLDFVYVVYYSVPIFSPSAMKFSRCNIRALPKSTRHLSKGLQDSTENLRRPTKHKNLRDLLKISGFLSKFKSCLRVKLMISLENFLL